MNAPLPEDAYQVRVFEAFEKLSTCRQIVMGAVGPIPWSAIDQYAQRMGVADDELAYEDFVAIVQELDEAFIEKRHKEIAAERKKQEQANNGRSRTIRRTTPSNRGGR